MKRFGTDDQLYWRGFLLSYEKSYSNKKQMQQEMSLRGLTDVTEYNFLSFSTAIMSKVPHLPTRINSRTKREAALQQGKKLHEKQVLRAQTNTIE